jgi:hypothetical protein
MLEDSKKYIKNIASIRIETKKKKKEKKRKREFYSSVFGKHGRKDNGDVGRAKITTRGAQKVIMMLKILMF